MFGTVWQLPRDTANSQGPHITKQRPTQPFNSQKSTSRNYATLKWKWYGTLYMRSIKYCEESDIQSYYPCKALNESTSTPLQWQINLQCVGHLPMELVSPLHSLGLGSSPLLLPVPGEKEKGFHNSTLKIFIDIGLQSYFLSRNIKQSHWTDCPI